MAEPTAAASGVRSTARSYIVALVLFLAAFLIRKALQPLLGETHPFTSFVLAVIFSAYYCGTGPATLVLLLGLMTADYFFIPPVHSFGFMSKTNAFGCLAYTFINTCFVFFSHLMRTARQRADRNAADALQSQKMLELEVQERKRAENEVRRLNEELERRVAQRTAELESANRELEAFSYSVSHDLRAPLRHVDGYAQILEEEFGPTLPPEVSDYLIKIRHGSQNMGRLVDDLLNLARVGKTELKRSPVELKPVIDEVVAELQRESPDRKIEWHIGAMPTLECDRGLMKLVFANLLSNAMKYTRPRDPALIEVSRTKTNGEDIICVRDNGVGFDMKYAAKLFGVFQRLHRPEEFEGTGVGLATVSRIVRMHGGKIWAESAADKGATFFFTIDQHQLSSNN